MEVGVRDLRAHLSRYLAQVREGMVIDVTDRDHLIARVVPVRHGETDISPELAALIAGGTVAWSGESYRVAAPELCLQGQGPTLAEILSADRGE